MKIAIIDDDPRCLKEAAAIANEYKAQRSDKNITLDIFSHPEDLLEASYKLGGYDVYILDIIMPDMNGIELGMKLRDAGYDGKIIYLTSSTEYSLDAFRVKAFDYIIKPVSKEAFFKTADEALASIAQKKSKSMIVKTKEKSVKLTYDSIMYAEFNKRAISYYLSGGRVVESVTVRTAFSQAMADLLADKRFAACGQSMVVNLDHITEVENTAVVFGEAYRPFLGEKLCRKLRDAWVTYLFDQEE